MRRLALAVVVLAALGAAGCGNKKQSYLEGDEAVYLTVGGLKYQVQLSRALNPTLPSDFDYLRGVAGGHRFPAGNEEWFAVFMRVENDGNTPRRSTGDFEIVDTLGKVYRPVFVSPARNPLAYTPRMIGAGAVYPSPDSVPGEISPRSGALILFKLNLSAYQNRPVDLLVRDPSGGPPGKVELDL